MDLRIQFSNSKELINLFKEAKDEHIEEYAVTKQTITELQKNSLQKVKNMRLICSYCKQIQNDQDEWKKASEITDDLSKITISHGVCPECYKTEVYS